MSILLEEMMRSSGRGGGGMAYGWKSGSSPFPKVPPLWTESPPPPYSSSDHSTVQRLRRPPYSPPPPPLPPRDQVIIGRHVANFDVNVPQESNSTVINYKRNRISLHKCFVNPIISSYRSCTDTFFCFVFILFLIGWGIVATIGFMWGNPERLIHPTDSAGRVCGVQRKGYYDLRDKPFLLYFDLSRCISISTVIAGCPTPQVCVSKCPQTTFTYLQLQGESTYAHFQKTIEDKMICKESVKKRSIQNFAELQKFIASDQCAPYTIHSSPVLGRCVPSTLISIGEALHDAQQANSSLDSIFHNIVHKDPSISLPSSTKNINGSSLLQAFISDKGVIDKVASDISVAWWQILTFFIATALIALLWNLIMKLLGGYMIWATMLFVIASLLTGSIYSWIRFKNLRESGAIDDFSFHPDIAVYFHMPSVWMIIAISLTVFLLVILLIFLFVFSRIKLAIALIEESSKAVGSMLLSIIFPLFPFLLHLCTFIFWAMVTMWLSTSGEENCRRPLTPGGELTNGTICDCSQIYTKDSECQYVNLKKDDRVIYLQLYNMFGFFWLTCFITAFSQMTLAGAFASYYWTFNKPKDIPSFPIIRSLHRTMKYHLGTIALGSLVLAFVKFITAILEYLQRKLTVAENKVAKFVLRCLSCLFWCLEVFLKFLTKNAYIMTAIYGKNFCTSSKHSFTLIMNNIVRYTVLDKVTDFLLFLGKTSITLGMSTLAFLWFTGRWNVEEIPRAHLYYHFVPILIVFIGAYFIADSFLKVYEMAVDTTFLCFLEDAECNDGTPDKPFYMSQELQRILGKRNQFITSPS